MKKENPLRILIVEDIPADVELTKRALSKEGIRFTSHVVETETEFINALEKFIPDIIISDFMMPQFDGMKALNIALKESPAIPFIILTGSMNEEIAVNCIKVGATDYIIKEHITRLPFAVMEAITQKKLRSEKEKTDKALLESEETYRLTAHQTGQIVYDRDMNSGVTKWVGAIEKILGYTLDEFHSILSKDYTLNQQIHPEDFGKVISLFEENKSRGKNYSVEYRIKRKNDTYILVEDNVVFLKDGKGNPYRMLGTIADITDRKSAEKILKESEKRYRDIFVYAPLGIYQSTRDDRFITANPKLADILGYHSVDELLKKNISKDIYYDPDERTKLIQKFEPIGSVANHEVRWKKKNGDMIWISLTSHAVKDESNNTLYFEGFVEDITERKRSEEELVQKEKRYREVVENAAEMIFTSDLHGRVTYCNEAGLKMSGYTMDELTNLTVYDMVVPEQRRILLKSFYQQYRSKNPLSYLEYYFRTKNGELCGLAFSSSLVYKKGSIVGFHIIARDVTERKRAEEALKQSLSLLEATLESTVDGILVVDKNGRIERYNNKFIELWKIPESVIQTHNDNDALNYVLDQLDDPDRFMKRVNELYKDTMAESFDLIEFKDGRVFERFSRPQLIGDKPIGRVWSFRDVTERKEAEEALKESEKKFRTVIEEAVEIVFTTDNQGYFTYMNPAGIRSSGYSLDELKEVKYEELIVPEHRQRVKRNYLRQYLERTTLITVEYPFRTKSGEIKWFNQNSRLIIENNEVKGFYIIARDVTERRKTEEALKESQEHYMTLFNEALDGVCLTDAETGLIIDCNQALSSLVGRERMELIGQPESILHPPNDQSAYSPAFKQKLMEKEAKTLEKQIVTSTGIIREVEIKAFHINIHGRDMLQEVFRDITERKRTEKVLRENESRYTSLVENLRQAYYEADSRSIFTYCNSELILISGYTNQELIGSSSLRLVAEEHRKHVAAEYKRWKKEKKTDMFVEFLAQKKNGEKFWVEQTTHFEFDESGHLKKAANIVKDIHERKLAEEALHESEEKFRNLVENITDVFYVSDGKGRFEYCSPNFFVFTGYSSKDVLGKSYVRVVAPIDREKVINHYTEESVKGVRDTGLEFRVIKKDGTTIWAEQTTRIIYNSEGRAIEYRNVVRDVTERKSIENALQESELKLRNIFDNSTNIFYSHDTNHVIQYISPQVKEILGYEVEEALIKWTEFATNNPINEIGFQKTIKAIETGEVQEPYELELAHKNGSRVWVEVREVPVEKNGKTILIVGSLTNITERKKAQEKISESEERFRTLFETSIEGILLADINEKIVLVNPRMAQMTGYAVNELIKMNFMQLIPPEEMVDHQFKKEERIKGRSDIYERRLITKNNSILWTLISASPVLDKDGNFQGSFGMFTDITEQKLAEEKIRKLYRGVEHSPASILITDIKGNLEYVNTKFCDVTGYSYVEVIGKNPSILSSGEKPKEEYAELWNTILAGKVWSGEFHNKKKNGELYWERASISGILNDRGEITHFISIQEDITEKKRNEDLMIKSESQFRSIWESSSDGMRLTDWKGKIIKVNDSFCKMVEKSKNELEDSFISSIQKEEKKDHILITHQKRFKEKNIKKYFEREIELWNGKRKWFGVSNSFIDLGGGETLLLGIFRDITDRKKSELELIEAKEKAEEMNRVKSYFFAHMSHELRTPFVGIMGYAELLSEILTDSETKSMAEDILKSSKRLTETLTNILDLTRFEFVESDMQLKNYDVTEIIEEVCIQFSKTAQLKKLVLKKNIQSKPINIRIDIKILSGILNNLVSNAIKFTERGWVEIAAEKLSKDDGQFLVLKVADTGIGIPKEKQDIIWQEFRQVSEGLNRSFEGAGIGLAIVKKYVELIGGKISLKSEKNRGTTVTVQIPIVETQVPAESDAKIEQPKLSETKNNIIQTPSGKKILYVEDDESARFLISRFLSHLYEVDLAENSEKALLKVQEKVYDAILMDINLGRGKSGINLANMIRDVKSYKDTPIIAVTAFSSKSDKREFLSQGMSHYISKPFMKNDLIALLDKVFNKDEKKEKDGLS